ncbi:MAG: tyrosine-type recombinase/integrase [Dehalococcoidia bacterium]
MARPQYYVDGFLLAKRLEGVLDYTLSSYEQRLTRFSDYIHDRDVTDLNTADIRDYLASRHDRVGRSTQHTELRIIRTFLNWLKSEDIIKANPANRVKLGRAPVSVVPTFIEADIRDMLSLCPVKTFLGCRNQLLLLLLLDTGVRIGEAQRLTWGDIHGDMVKVNGKGAKERWVRIGSLTQKALWRYGMYRNGYDALWLSEERRPMTVDGLKITVHKLARRAWLTGSRRSAHTFRHTFAINFLRNGGGEFALQQLLGHSTLTMTRRYTQSLDAEDAARVHERYSPVDNMFKSVK